MSARGSRQAGRLYEWPGEDAPVRDWLLPLSASMRNVRENSGCSVVEPRSNVAAAQVMRKINARRRTAHGGGDG